MSGMGEAMTDHSPEESVPLCGKPSLRVGIRYIHPGKANPLTSYNGQTGLDGSILVFPGVRAGLA